MTAKPPSKIILGCIILALTPQSASAMMAAKYERIEIFAEAMHHVDDAAHMLTDPITKIEYTGGEVRFIAGPCYVPVKIEYSSGKTASGAATLGGGTYKGTLGKADCESDANRK